MSGASGHRPFRSSIVVGSPLPVFERLQMPVPQVGWVTIAGDPIPPGGTLEEFVVAYTAVLSRTVPGFRETRRATSPMLGLPAACLLEFEAHPEGSPATTHIHCCAVHSDRGYVIGATLPAAEPAAAGPVLAALMRAITVGTDGEQLAESAPPDRR